MDAAQPLKSSILYRRSSLSASTELSLATRPRPVHFLSLPNGAVSPSKTTLDLELVSLKSSSASSLTFYTSLKDVLPYAAAVNSPTASSASWGDISIRNRLVKQAASAYLSPAATLSPCTGPSFLHRICLRLSTAARFVAGFLNRVLCSIRIPVMAG